jgi:hypothetical protein
MHKRAHRLRICCGNGLRADIWEKLQKRLAVPHILEFYASTEGNSRSITKGDLQRESFDPAATSDPIYFDDPASNAFVPLDGALYAGLAAGKIRFSESLGSCLRGDACGCRHAEGDRPQHDDSNYRQRHQTGWALTRMAAMMQGSLPRTLHE